ncbi:hypothetical protein F0562_002521 [Nyssa sinensis]|uniref:FLZ-type domain-containing protein n=1 Tax=Nyssa sinensis TaxID=561372 RepID=A0A5J5C9S6_9ASTE|nr:hypothetical protein F0562_002521 [Nyssa sinensis]
MPVKRSRIGRSSSFGETGVFNHVLPPVESADGRWERLTAPTSSVDSRAPNNSPKVLKSSVAEKSDKSRPRILTLSSPVQDSTDVSDKELIGGFLEKCYYCKKKIREDNEVFMYSYLRAFCTAECRDMQIAMDNAVEKVCGSKEMSSNVKDQIGF